MKSLTVAAALAALSVVPVQAQTGWGSLGLHGGYLRGGELADPGFQDAELGLDNGWVVGGSLEFWMGSSRRLGLRLDGSYAEPGFYFGENELVATDPETDAFAGSDVNVWMGDINLMFRPWGAEPDRNFLPFLTVGAGGMRWDPADELVGVYEPAQVEIREDQGEFAWTFGLGADAFLSDNVALRFEVKDYFNGDSPYRHSDATTGPDWDDYGGGHNVIGRVGLNFFWGARDRVIEPGFIAEEPEVEPEPMPEPEPEPPATETVTRCVVADDGSLRTVTATRYVDSGRLVVEQNGREVAFTTAYPATSPRYVRSATWYVNDEPLTVWVTDEGDLDDEIEDALDDESEITHLEFVRFGSPSSMSTSNLVFVGTVDGTPIYASRNDVATTLPRLRTALETDDDLEVILRNDADLARDIADIETMYVAVEPGCVFQPISLTTYVRRTRG